MTPSPRARRDQSHTRGRVTTTNDVARPDTPPSSPADDLQGHIAKRAYELYIVRGYHHGSALDDWLEAEREILSQMPPV